MPRLVPGGFLSLSVLLTRLLLHTFPFASSCLSFFLSLCVCVFRSCSIRSTNDGRPRHYCRNLGLGGLGLALTSDVMCLLFPNEISRSLRCHETRHKVGSLTGHAAARGSERVVPQDKTFSAAIRGPILLLFSRG